MQAKQLLFYTGATNFFHNYIPLYFLFGALEHPGASFEFLVRDIPRMQALHGESLDRISALTGSLYYLHDVEARSCRKSPLMENSFRFLLQPFLQSEFVYIGDIDILLTENILAKHHAFIDSGLPFFNVIRPGTKRLTGLHLARYADLYPLPGNIWDYCDINDEEILYKSYELKDNLFHPELDALSLELGRPNCGIHVSTNRLPFSMSKEQPGWGIYSRALRKISNYFDHHAEVRSVVEGMYRGSRMILMNIIVISRGLKVISEEDRSLFLLKGNELRLGS